MSILSNKNINLDEVIISENNTNERCNEEINLKSQRKVLNENIKSAHNDCENSKYTIIYKYFNEEERKSKLVDLLNALMHYYKDEKSKDKNFILPFQQFIDMFEFDTMKKKNFKKQHVFEALCKILLMYDYDEGELGRNKEFYSSLNNFIKNPRSSIIDRDDIIREEVNVGSESGVVDIFFKTKKNTDNKYDCEWVCDCINENKTEDNEENKEKQEYVLIQNKYYSKEKSDIKNYDVTKIYANARKLYESKEIIPRIVLMVNNKQSLSDKLTRSRDTSKGLIDGIYGVYEIDKWFNLLLYDLYNSENIEDFLQKRGSKNKIKPELGARFHQIYFTNSTMSYYNDGYKKFIWGAVPRSGKSYMIGDFISKRKQTQFNDVVLILGAKSETEMQFIKMFCDYADYNDYGIIKTSNDKMKKIKDCNNLNVLKERNIFIFSQEWFKNKIKIVENNSIFDFGNKENFFRKLFFNGNNIDIYFDEIHKGGSTDKSESILNAINNSGTKIDVFIMVTATFAKPNIKYKTNFIDTKEPKILEWSYEDQQIMKNIKNETKMDMMINSRTGKEREIIRNIFELYNLIYGAEYLDIISNQYARHPELVLVQPYDIIKNRDFENFQIEQIFKSNLKCEACYEKQSIYELQNPNNIFNDYGRVQNLLEFIAGSFRPDNSMYGYLKSIGAPDYADKHSELWFLPDDDLYITPDECRLKCKQIKEEETHDENKNIKKSLPNIEPITRGLAFAIMKNPFFKKFYNVLIVHNTKVDFNDIDTGSKLTYNDIYNNTGISTILNSEYIDKSLSEIIKEYEKLTYEQNKNLIILTGAKLRLGISLPCVDIAFNFDNIQSVDVNYQTMFRVLTERYNKPKKYGYYIDFNKERFIKFLYQYSNTYSHAKNISSIKENVSHLQGLLLLFNINGIGLKKLNERSELKIYNSLINELDLDESGFKKHYSSFDNITRLFKNSLIAADINNFKNIKNFIENNNLSNQRKIMKTLKEGSRVKPHVVSINEDNQQGYREEEQDINEDNENDNESNVDIINTIADLLPRIITLLALFSNKKEYNCDTLDDCLKNAMRKIEEFGQNCECDIVSQSDILSCYFNTPFYHRKLLLLLKSIQELLQNPINLQLHNSANFIFNNIKEMSKNNQPLIMKMTPEEIQSKIEKHLPIREEKKDRNGEVFTPITLINEMMDKLPTSVWKNPNLKWLDPANGIGNFPMVVYIKLLENLPDTYNGENGSYSGEMEKKRYIIEKMLYMVELDPSNVKISRRIFGSNANISCANFLEQQDKWKRDFKGIDMFDVIMGNPPFQPEKTEDDKRQGGHGIKKLWDIFVKKSLELLIDNGFLCFITPASWRKPENILYDLMTKQNQLLYLHIISKKGGQEQFGVSQRVDLYIIQKHRKTKNTEIIDELDNKIILDIGDWAFLPNYDFKKIKNIMTPEENGINVIYDTFYHGSKNMNKTKKEKTEKFKYPVVHGITLEGLSIIYSDNKTKGHFGVPKVILNMNENQYPVNDYEGKYGMSELSFGIPITSKKQGDDIVRAINSDEFKEIIKATKWGAFQTNWRMFKFFKPDFYKYFLKEEAGKKIKRFITKKHKERKNKNQTKKSKKGGKTYKRNIKTNKTKKI